LHLPFIASPIYVEKGSIFVRCDYEGNMYVRLLMDDVFGKENFRNEIIISRTRAKQQAKNQFIQQTESLFFYCKSHDKVLLNEVERPISPKWHPLLHFPRADCKPRVILGKLFYPPRNRRWALSQERINKFENEGKIRINEKLSYIDCKGNRVVGIPELLYDAELVGNEWLDIPGYSQAQHFPTENSESLLKRVIQSTSNEGDLVLDFFLGSGTTTAVAHKLKRKWIGVEMGDHFWTVILPRMKRVLTYDKSGISKDKDVKEKYNEKNTGGFFKYQILEQYEDVIENLEDNTDYTKHPFDYKRKINLLEVGEPEKISVDVVETFIYEFGIKIKTIKRVWHNERLHVFVIGEKDGKNVAMVWIDGGDCEASKDFINKQIELYDIKSIYTNCELKDRKTGSLPTAHYTNI
jgi:adenine-specific DNA-methyltransferase